MKKTNSYITKAISVLHNKNDSSLIYLKKPKFFLVKATFYIAKAIKVPRSTNNSSFMYKKQPKFLIVKAI